MQATAPHSILRAGRASAALTRRNLVNRVFGVLVTGAAVLGVALLVMITAYIVIQGLPAWNLEFFIGKTEPVGVAQGGIGHAIVGSLIMLVVASLIGIPLGLGAAIYLSEYGRGRLADATRFAIETLAGVPSIVIGAFIWGALVRNVIGGFSGLAGGVALGILMIPIVARTAEEVLRLVPDSLREASLALGIPVWKTILRVVMPTARAGLLTAVVLAAARAAGESAPLLMTSLGNDFYNTSPDLPMAALPLLIYKYALSPYEEWQRQAWGAALVLIVVIGVISFLTRFFVGRATRSLQG